MTVSSTDDVKALEARVALLEKRLSQAADIIAQQSATITRIIGILETMGRRLGLDV